MKKALSILTVLVCILVVLAGCSNKKGEESSIAEGSQPTIASLVKIIEEKGVFEISIYKSESHGIVGKTVIKKLTSSNEYSTVPQALKTAKEIPGILNTATPDYDFVIKLKNSESIAFHFWLKPTDETGMFYKRQKHRYRLHCFERINPSFTPIC